MWNERILICVSVSLCMYKRKGGERESDKINKKHPIKHNILYSQTIGFAVIYWIHDPLCMGREIISNVLNIPNIFFLFLFYISLEKNECVKAFQLHDIQYLRRIGYNPVHLHFNETCFIKGMSVLYGVWFFF